MAFSRVKTNAHVRLTTRATTGIWPPNTPSIRSSIVSTTVLSSRQMSSSSPTSSQTRESSVSLSMHVASRSTMELLPTRHWTPDRGIRFATTQVASRWSSSGVTELIREVDCTTAPRDDEYFSCEETSSSAQVLPIKPERELPQPEEPFVPPRSSLPFNIPEDVFLNAKNAPEFSESSYWSYSLYRGPPNSEGKPTKVSVHYCRSRKTMERVVSEYFMNEPVIGLDLEWVAESSRHESVRKNVSLIQIASPSRIALFHVALFPEADDKLVSSSLKEILEDEGVSKCGVCIKADCTRLKTYMGLDVKGIVELSNLYKVVKYSAKKEYELINKRTVRLADQVHEYLKLPLFKGEVRVGNWSEPLTMPQIIYSASDAYAGVQLYQVYEDKRLSLDPLPPRPHFAELGLPIPLPEGVVISKKRSKKTNATVSATETVQVGNTFEEEVTVQTVETVETVETQTMDETIVYEAPNEEQDETLEETNDQLPIREDHDKTLEILSKYFDVEKLALAMKDTIQDEDKSIITFDDSQRKLLISEANAFRQDFQERHEADEKVPGAQHLRSFYLWQKRGYTPNQISHILRQPPLAMSTVCGYVMEVIRHGKEEYDKDRLQSEIVPRLSRWHRFVQYKDIIPPDAADLDLLSRAPSKTMGSILRKHLEAAVAALPVESDDLLDETQPPVAEAPEIVEPPVQALISEDVKKPVKRTQQFRSSSFVNNRAYEDFAYIVDETPPNFLPGEEFIDLDARLARETARLQINSSSRIQEPAEETPKDLGSNLEEKIYYPPIRPMI